jgi:hypothetical protein
MGIIAWIVLGLVRAEKRLYQDQDQDQDRQPLVDERRVYQDKPPL